MALAQGRLPTWAVIWLAVSFPIVIWDALYIIFRPRSMAGGDLEHIWAPYKTYIQADGRYKDMTDGFGIAQSWLNLVEVAVLLVALFAHFKGKPSAVFWAFTTCLMTAAKTACYFLTEICSGFEYTGAALAVGDHYTFWVVFVIPSSFWLIIPLIVCWVTGQHILHTLNKHAKSDGASKREQRIGKKKAN